MITDVLPYWPCHPSDVSKEAWPFAHHLNELHRKSMFFDRVWQRIEWHRDDGSKARTPVMDRLFASGVESRELWAFAQAQSSKWRDDLEVARALSDALAMIAPDLFDARTRLFEELGEDREGVAWVSPGNPNEDRQLNVTGYLCCIETVHAIFGQRFLELEQLRAGHHLHLWRASAQRVGAARGGRKSAETRQAKSRATAEKVQELAEEYRRAGRAKHEIAGIIGQRIDVTADYVRALLRKSRPVLPSERD